MYINKTVLSLKEKTDDTKKLVMEMDVHLKGKLTVAQMNELAQMKIDYPVKRAMVHDLSDLVVDDKVKKVSVYIEQEKGVVSFDTETKPGENLLAELCATHISPETDCALVIVTQPNQYSSADDGDNQVYLARVKPISLAEPTYRHQLDTPKIFHNG